MKTPGSHHSRTSDIIFLFFFRHSHEIHKHRLQMSRVRSPLSRSCHAECSAPGPGCLNTGSGDRTLARPGLGTIAGRQHPDTRAHCVVVNFTPEETERFFSICHSCKYYNWSRPYLSNGCPLLVKILNFVNEVLKLGPAIIKPQIADCWW